MGDFSVLALRIKELRKSLSMTQKDFSAYVGCTAATLSAYENDSKSPSLEIIKSIAEKCHVSIDWLCGITNEIKNEDNIETYADLIRLFLKIQNLEFAPCGFYFKAYRDFNSFKELENIEVGIFTRDEVMYTITQNIQKMQNVLADETIDQNIYDTWLEGFLEKYNVPLPTWASITGHNPDESQQSNPLMSILRPEPPEK